MKGLTSVGEWLSLVEHLVRDQGVGGSNPLSPTNSKALIGTHSGRNWAQLRESEAQSYPLCRHCTKHPVYLYPGASVPYHFVGDDDDKFRLDFSYKGPVRVKGTVDYDAEGNPTHVSVAEVERLQTELPLPEPEHR